MTLRGRTATRADIDAFCPEMTCSFRAWACDLDGEPQGVIGVALFRPMPCMFSRFKAEFREHLRSMTVLRLIKKAEAAVHASRVPVTAFAERGEPTAIPNLKRFGFRFSHWQDGVRVYVWEPV